MKVLKTIQCIAFACNSSLLSASDSSNLREVESIIDRLEKKLLQQEMEAVLPEGSLPSSPKQRANTRYSYPETNIEARLPDQSKFNELENAINRIRENTQRLGADVESIKTKIERSSKLDSYIEISANLKSPEDSHLRELRIYINEFPLYELNPDIGFWNARNQIPVFSGPLPQGRHKVRFEARVVNTAQHSVPMASNIYQIYKQSFEIDVGSAKTHRGYRIIFEPKTEKRLNDVAKVEKYDL